MTFRGGSPKNAKTAGGSSSRHDEAAAESDIAPVVAPGAGTAGNIEAQSQDGPKQPANRARVASVGFQQTEVGSSSSADGEEPVRAPSRISAGTAFDYSERKSRAQKSFKLKRQDSTLPSDIFRSATSIFHRFQSLDDEDDGDESDALEDHVLQLLTRKTVPPNSEIIARLHAHLEEAEEREVDTKWTTLHYAPNVDVLEELIKAWPAGAKVPGATGSLPLHVANTSRPMVDALLRAYPEGAKHFDAVLRLPLHAALEKSRPKDVIEALVKAHPDAVVERDLEGRLPIQIAYERKLPRPWVDILLKADPFAESAVDAINDAAGQGSYAYQMAQWCLEYIDSRLISKFCFDGPAALLLTARTYRASMAAANRAQSSNTEIAEQLRDTSERLQLKAAGLAEQLSKAELEGLLESPLGSVSLQKATESNCKQMIARPRVQTFLQARYLGAQLSFLFSQGTAWFIDVVHVPGQGLKYDFFKARLFQGTVLMLNLLLVHPPLLVACGLVPPLVQTLKRWVPEVRVLPKDNSLPLGAHVLHRVPVVVTMTTMAMNIALAWQLSRLYDVAPGLDGAVSASSALGTLLQAFADDPWYLKPFWWRYLLVGEPGVLVLVFWLASASFDEARQLVKSTDSYLTDPNNVLELPAKLLSLFALLGPFGGLFEPTSELAAGSLAAGVTLLWTSQLLRLLMLSPVFGPFILMIFKMLVDVGKWLVILFCVLLPSAIGLHVVYARDALDEGEHVYGIDGENCADVANTIATSLWGTILILVQRIFGGSEVVLDCVLHSKHPQAGLMLMLYYSVMTIILLVNLLIAVMARTFDNIYESATLNYQHQVAVVVLAALEQGPVPAPFSLLSLPYGLFHFLSESVPKLVDDVVKNSSKRKPGARHFFSMVVKSVKSVKAVAKQEHQLKAHQAFTQRVTKVHKDGKLEPKILEFVNSHLGEELRDERQRTMLQKNIVTALQRINQVHERVEELHARLAPPAPAALPPTSQELPRNTPAAGARRPTRASILAANIRELGALSEETPPENRDSEQQAPP